MVTSVAMAASFAVHAAPASESDPLSRFLAYRESADSSPSQADASSQQPGFVQQMRSKASDMVVSSMRFLGVPYVRGGDSADTGFDCSGFTRYVFEHSLGLVLPRRADEQAKAAGLVKVKRDELKPGDLVFFNTLRRTFSHVGIYIGEGKFIHSPRSGSEVRVEDMRESYWTKRFTGARRAPQIEGVTSVPAVSAGSVTSQVQSFTTSSFGAPAGASQDPLGLLSSPGTSPSNRP